jgi:hypothetical protein
MDTSRVPLRNEEGHGPKRYAAFFNDAMSITKR